MSVPAVDPELLPTLRAVQGAVHLVGLKPHQIADLRDSFAHTPSDRDLSCGGGYAVHELDLGRSGERLLATLCRPNVSQGVPVIYYLHGGGMVAGHRRSNLQEVVAMAAQVGAAVLSLEYSLAPERPYPQPHDDAWSGLEWLREQGPEFGLDPDRIVLSGTSAGGGLAAATAIRGAELSTPGIVGAMLMSPMLDDRHRGVSSRQMVGRGLWDLASNRTGWNALLGEGHENRDLPPTAVPARATSLHGVAPLLLDVADGETFRDQVVEFASLAWASGVSTELHVWPGGFHGFDSIVPTAALSVDAKAARVRWLRRLLSPDGADVATSE